MKLIRYIIPIFFACAVGFSLFLYQENIHNEITSITNSIITVDVLGIKRKQVESLKQNLVNLFEEKCLVISLSEEVRCRVSTAQQLQTCLDQVTILSIYENEPICVEYKKERIKTPDRVGAVYLTSMAVGSKTFRDKVITQLESSELLNSVVIDVKEVDGVLPSKDFLDISDNAKVINYVIDFPNFLDELREKKIYRIARVTVFKDTHIVLTRPEWAVKKKNKTDVWFDWNKKAWIDPGAQEYWDYIIEISSQAYELGFDEINLDYIRFPSDGNMKDIWYPYSQAELDADAARGRVTVINGFLQYYTSEMRKRYPDIVISGDVFGMVTTNTDDLTIGQNLESMLVYLDFVAPMVYPSHYPVGFINLSGHPDNHPYEVIYHSMNKAVERAKILGNSFEKKLRPWIQDFTCTWCAGYFPYGKEEIELQIKAAEDAGTPSFMLWNPNNRYQNASQIIR